MFIKHIYSKIQCAYLCTQCWTHIVLYKLHAWDSHSLSINMYMFIYVPYWEIYAHSHREICLFVIYFPYENCEEKYLWCPPSPSFKIEQMYASILGRGSQCMLSSKAPIGWHWYPWNHGACFSWEIYVRLPGKGTQAQICRSQKRSKILDSKKSDSTDSQFLDLARSELS